jgi:hypothetical protein
VESLEALKAFCSENNRAVPTPDEWNRLWQMLRNKTQKANGGWEPSLPLILAAWWSTMPLEKVLRFHEHLRWAEQENQLDEISNFLRGLSEDKWMHFGELPT